MRHFRAAFATVLVCSTLAGCGKSAYQQNREVGDEMVSIFNEYADALESVKDEETAKAAAVKINAANDRLEKLVARKDKIPKVSKADKEKLDKEYKPKFAEAAGRLQKVAFSAGLKSKGEKSFLEALQRMQSIASRVKK